METHFKVITDARNSQGDLLDGYGELTASIHSSLAEAEAALSKAPQKALHGHNHAQVWEIRDDETAFGHAEISF